MKCLIALLFAVSFTSILNGQQGISLNNDGTAPDASSVLDLQSTSKGFLMPRMTKAHRLAINNPEESLLVFQIDNIIGFYYYSDCYGWQILGDTITGGCVIADTMLSTDVTANGGSDGTATVSHKCGAPPYSYMWTDGQSTQTAVGLNAGNHCVTVSDANSCTFTSCVSLSEPLAFSIPVSNQIGVSWYRNGVGWIGYPHNVYGSFIVQNHSGATTFGGIFRSTPDLDCSVGGTYENGVMCTFKPVYVDASGPSRRVWVGVKRKADLDESNPPVMMDRYIWFDSNGPPSNPNRIIPFLKNQIADANGAPHSHVFTQSAPNGYNLGDPVPANDSTTAVHYYAIKLHPINATELEVSFHYAESDGSGGYIYHQLFVYDQKLSRADIHNFSAAVGDYKTGVEGFVGSY